MDLAYTPDPYGCGGNCGNAQLACGPLAMAGEADGAASGAAASFTLSPMAMQATAAGTAGTSYALLACSPLQIAGEADGAAQGTAGGILTEGGLTAAAGGSAMATGHLAGSLRIAGEGDGTSSTGATMTGGGIPVPLTAGGGGSGAANATLETGMGGEGSGAAGASGAIALATGLYGTSAGNSATAAKLRLHWYLTAGSHGIGAGSATPGALAQLSGFSGPAGWERPQIAGTSGGRAGGSAALTITGNPSVTLAGSS